MEWFICYGRKAAGGGGLIGVDREFIEEDRRRGIMD